MLARLGRFTAQHRFVIIVAWTLAIVAGAILGGGVFDRTVDVDDAPPGAESTVAQQRLDALDPEGEIITAVIAGEDFYSPAVRESAVAAMSELRAIPGVIEVMDAYTAGGLIGDDGRSSLVTVELDAEIVGEEALEVAAQVAAVLHGIDAPEVLVGGELLGGQAFVDRAAIEAAIGEGIAILVILVILVIVLGGFRVGVLPIVTALATVLVALLMLSGVATVFDVNEFAVNIVTILGLGLSIDYSLLMIMRFRDERRADPDAALEELMSHTVATAGRAVLISGLAVCIALGGILLLGDPLLSGMALGGVIAVVIATLAGLTLVPATISVTRRHIPDPGTRTWVRPWTRPSVRTRIGMLGRSTRFAQRRPVLVTVAASAALLVLAAPLAGLVVDSSDIRSLPVSAEERKSYEAVTTGFEILGVEPVTVFIDAPVSDPRVQQFLDTAAALDDVDDAIIVPDLPADVTAADFTPVGGEATGATAQQLARDIRALNTELDVMVTGPAAGVVDTQTSLLQRAPLALGFVIVSTLALLYLLTRSLVVPLKALLLNALTIAATMGALVAIFQWGWGSELLGFAAWGALDVTTPVFIALLSFGLAMDYEVFLLARIHEGWRGRGPTVDLRAANDAAVRKGITATGPVVTLAAVAISIVFIGFASGSLVAMKTIGVGMLIAIVLDVTVIRGLLLPAAMTLLGKWNWWPHHRVATQSSATPEPTKPPELVLSA